jgi:hypothetical protein
MIKTQKVNTVQHSGGSTKIKRDTIRNYKRRVPEMLPAMADNWTWYNTLQGNYFKRDTTKQPQV